MESSRMIQLTKLYDTVHILFANKNVAVRESQDSQTIYLTYSAGIVVRVHNYKSGARSSIPADGNLFFMKMKHSYTKWRNPRTRIR